MLNSAATCSIDRVRARENVVITSLNNFPSTLLRSLFLSTRSGLDLSNCAPECQTNKLVRYVGRLERPGVESVDTLAGLVRWVLAVEEYNT